jgi:hypothetical protein
MKVGKTTDIWQVGILHAPIARCLDPHNLKNIPITWLPPQPDFCFIADPFGVWQGDVLTVFVEAYDYRDKKGVIHYYSYSRHHHEREEISFQLLRCGLALEKPFHLSYPFVFEHEGVFYMLPEARKSGKLTLYRARSFPEDWQEVATLLHVPAVDASLTHYEGRWWLFYAVREGKDSQLRTLHAAFADTLTGQWTPHPRNPIYEGIEAARPGGTPFVHHEKLTLPMQDCRQTYGGAVNFLQAAVLMPEEVKLIHTGVLTPQAIATPFADGLHTLSSAGDVTLLDVKRLERAPRWRVDWQRRLQRLVRFRQ